MTPIFKRRLWLGQTKGDRRWVANLELSELCRVRPDWEGAESLLPVLCSEGDVCHGPEENVETGVFGLVGEALEET